jgi:hypothetical protein
MMRNMSLIATMISLAACSGETGGNTASDSEPDNAQVENIAINATWPASLKPFGEGYPKVGDPCRRVGESDATSNYLDDSSDLVGCPSKDVAAALGGKAVATVEGIYLVSVPRGDSGQVMSESEDALVPGTDYQATSSIPCGAAGTFNASCKAGVKRKMGPDGTTFVEVTRPNGMTRILYFQGAKATGADSSEADGSSTYSFKATRDADDTLIEYGPERYRIPDALVVGG